MAELASLWVGQRMSKIQEMCLTSFVAYGHKMHLYTYEERDDVPEGVVVKDGSEIMPFDNLGKLANFADVFRFKMVQKTGYGWVDADTLCLTEDWDFLDNCYAILQKNGEIQNGIFRLPPDSEILEFIIKEAESIDRSNCHWPDTGGRILMRAFEKYPSYNKYSVDETLVNGVSWFEWEKLWDPKYLKEMVSLSKKIKSFSIFNEMASRAGIDKNYFPKGSAMEYFYYKIIKKAGDKRGIK